MSRPEPQLAIDRFLYSRAGNHVAHLDLRGSLYGELAGPGAELRISRAPLPALTFAASEQTTGSGSSAAPTWSTAWQAGFSVPYAVVEQPRFGFELLVPGLAPIELGRPQPSWLEPDTATAGTALTLSDGRATAGGMRTRAIALATALAVTATATPAAALADTYAVTHAEATAHRIAHLARFATERAQAHAARKQERSAARRAAKRAARARKSGAAKPDSRCVSSTAARAARRHHQPSATAPGAVICPAPAPAAHPRTHHHAHGTHQRGAGKHETAGTPHGTMSSAGGETAAPTAAAGATPPAGPPSPLPGTTTPVSTSPAPTTTPPSTTAAGGTPAPPAGTPTAPTPTPTTPSATTPAAGGTPSGGVPTGSGTTPVSTPPTPTPPAVTDPRPTATGTQHRSTAAPGTPAGGGRRVTGSGGSPLHPRAHHAARRALATGGSGLLSTTPPGYLGPRSWTGSAANDPALLQALGDLSNLLRNGDTPPRFLIPIYMAAGRRFHLPWQVLAGINAVESDYGRDLNTSTAGAIGWMQFEPGTWKEYGMAVDGHSVANPYDPVDAIFSAARYLAAAGGAQDISRAIYAYNHATWYVNMVLARARAIGDRIHPHTHTGRRGMIHVYFAFARRHWRAHYHSGWLSHYDRLIAAANMVSAANFPYLYGGGHEQPARFGPFDCSGSVSYVMQQAGYRVPTTVSGEIPIWKFPAGPGRVTIFYNAGHTFMRIGSRYFGTSGFARPGGGAGWFSTDKLPVGYLANFREVHVPRLGVDSFAPSRPGRAGRPGTPGQATDSAHRAKRAHGTGPSAGVTLTPFVSTNAYTLRVLAPLA